MSDTTTPPIVSITGGSDGTEAEYGQMVALSHRFESVAGDLMSRSTLGATVMGNGDLMESAVLAPHTFAAAQAAIVLATTGPSGLTVQAGFLEVSAITMRNMVSAYTGVDALQRAAFEAFDYGTGFALGATPIALPFALAAYARMTPEQRANLPGTLQQWAEDNPGMVQHLINGSGGLVDGLQASTGALLTPALGPFGGRALWGSLGIDPFNPTTGAAAADLAGLYRDGEPTVGAFTQDDSALSKTPPGGVADLMANLDEVNAGEDGLIRVQQVGAAGRYIVYIPGTDDMATLPGQSDETIRDMGANLKLMGGDQTAYGRGIIEAINRSTPEGSQVTLVGHSQGGMTAAEIASVNGSDGSQHFKVDHVVTAGSPTSQVESLPSHVSMLSLENSGDVIPLTDGEPNPESANRTTVRFDANTGSIAGNHRIEQYVQGGQAIDAYADTHHEGSLPNEINSLGDYLGYREASSQSVIIERKP
ncbi:hypothetical protein [Nocardioides aurantiacus]|uniref:PGAP1-like protein n=1 Tax=Nocardioides aurantiacus TaxID=86796 RepID=A0A3N2CTY6_9ACTN|nr:hypothetical protein [Nocardioides aurantiacus]ROR90971.1 hypothetical protein EDD33_1828 [Nocardioides aurantiacus]